MCSHSLSSMTNPAQAEAELSSTKTSNRPVEKNNDVPADDDDEIFDQTSSTDDDQARIRRRAPTRHSIKSLTGRKTALKQTSSTEVNESSSSSKDSDLYSFQLISFRVC